MMDYTAVGMHQFYTFLLVFSRVTGVIVASPLLGNRAIPAMTKAGFCLVCSLALVPMIEPHTGPIPDHLLLLAAGVVKDGLLGIALGYISRVLFAGIEMAGYLVDTQMGFGFVNLVDPFSQQQSSVMSTFQYQLAVTLYLLANGHLALFQALVDSFRTVPPGMIVPNAAFGMAAQPFMLSMLMVGLRLALPAFGVLMVADIAMALTARMVPQMNVFMVGIPAKILIGMSALVMALPVIAIIVGQIITGTNTGFQALLAGVH